MDTQNPTPPQKNSRSEQARINGAKSQGPITPEGKAISSKNALKHGFAAKSNVVIELEDPVGFDAHVANYRASFKPQDPVELELVDEIAAIKWRKSRAVAAETALIDFQLSIQEKNVHKFFPPQSSNEDQAKFELALVWQALARKSNTKPVDNPTVPPDGLDIGSIELARRYQVSLDRQYRSALTSNAGQTTRRKKAQGPKRRANC